LAEEYIGRPVANIPYNASVGGQYLARAGLQEDSGEATLDYLRATVHLTGAFVAAGSVVAPLAETVPASSAMTATSATEARIGAAAAEEGSLGRPSWRQSELDVGAS